MSTSTIPERIQSIIDYSKISRRAFGIKLGYRNGAFLLHLLNGRNGISAKLANSIVEVYPEINYKWILAGEGEMIIEPKEDETSLGKRLDELEKIVESNKIKIELQSSYIKNFELQIENFKLKAAK